MKERLLPMFLALALCIRFLMMFIIAQSIGGIHTPGLRQFGI